MAHHTAHTISAVFLVLVRDNNRQVLLSKRQNTGYHDGDFGLVAGHVEPGESYTQAIIREAHEEAGIILSPQVLTMVHAMHRRSEFDQSERIDVYFRAQEWEGTVTNAEPDKCSQLEWHDFNQLPINLIPSVRQAIELSQNGIQYSEFGWNIETTSKKSLHK